MEKNIFENEMNQCYNYCKKIEEYEKYVNQNYQNLNNNYVPYRGYLIDLREFEKFKEYINYKIFKENKNNYKERMLVKLVLKKKSFKLKKFVINKFQSSDDLLNLLYEGHEYIIINIELGNNLCEKGKENESFFIYYINKEDLLICLNNTYVYFKHNKNIISKNLIIYKAIQNKNIINIDNNQLKYSKFINYDINKSLVDDKSSKSRRKNINNNIIINELLSLVEIMKDFYLFEKKISEKFKSANEFINSGYFIDKKIIDEWKQNTKYNDIKSNYFVNHLNDKSELDNKIVIINYLSQTNNKIEINNKLKFKSINNLTKEEFKNFTKTNSFVLIDKNLYILLANLKEEINESEIKYTIKDKKISFKYNDLDYCFYLNSNIIYSELDYNFLILIKYFYFYETLKKNIASGNEKSPTSFVIIDKEAISKYKKFFNYDNIYTNLKNENFIELYNKENNIFSNEEKIFEKINFLRKNYNNSINDENMDIEWNKQVITNFKRNDGQNNKIINNFEIIEIRLAIQLLKRKKENKNNLLIGRFHFIKNKILVIFKEENSFYFQIGFINDQNTFIVEYILDVDYDKNKIKNLIDFDQFFKNINKDYFLKKIFNNNRSNSFLLDNNYKIKLYNISNNNSNQNLLYSLNGESRAGVDIFKDSQKNYEKNEEEKLKKYLEILLIFYKIENDFKKNLNLQHYLKDEEEYFIINEEWIQLFKSNSHYKEILNNINEHFNNIDNIEQIANEFFKIKIDNITPYLNNLKSLFENNLTKLYEINNNSNNNDKFKNNFYYNFGLINQNFFDILKNLNLNINIIYLIITFQII